jgi:AAA+ ATPase superfamily predicted ATPase
LTANKNNNHVAPYNPFKFGSDIARGRTYFADRESEMKKLRDWLKEGERVVVFCSRRLGKTALIVNALDDLSKEGYLTAYLDVSTTPSKSLFVSKYRSLFIEEKTREWFIDWIRRNLPKIKVALGEAKLDLSELSKEELDEAFDKILDLPQQLASKYKKKVVVAFDEFHEIGSLDSGSAENLMRSKFQFHDRVTYVFSGSKAHLLQDMFESKGKPFYKSAQMFELQKIPRELYSKFITRAFRSSGITIKEITVDEILSRTELNTYYTQQLCHEIWDVCKLDGRTSVEHQDVERAIDQVISNQSAVYEKIWEDLAPSYRKVLIGMVRHNLSGDQQLWSKEFRQENRLSVGSIDKAIKHLTDDYLIEKRSQERANSGASGGFAIPDPFFVKWLSRRTLS